MGVDLKCEVLESVAVADGPGCVVLSHADNARVLSSGVVFNDTLTDLGDVEQTVKKIRCPVEVGSTVGDAVAEHTHALERTTELV